MGLTMINRLQEEQPMKGLQSLFCSLGDFFDVFFLQHFVAPHFGIAVSIVANSGSITRKHTMLKNIQAANFITPNIIFYVMAFLLTGLKMISGIA
jgi:hypothetical protein